MGMKMTVDDRRLREGLNALQRGLGFATEEAARSYADRVVEGILARWPRDTNRSARGFEQAGNAAGLQARPLSIVRASRIGARLQKKLEQNLDFWNRRVLAQQNQARTRGIDPTRWPSHRRALRRRDKAAADLGMFLAKNGQVLVLGLKQRLGDRQISVREKLYGGSGSTVTDGTRAVVVLVNHEPHARFLERRLRVVQHSLAEAATGARLQARNAMTAAAPARWRKAA